MSAIELLNELVIKLDDVDMNTDHRISVRHNPSDEDSDSTQKREEINNHNSNEHCYCRNLHNIWNRPDDPAFTSLSVCTKQVQYRLFSQQINAT